jgi:hypothetical protein
MSCNIEFSRTFDQFSTNRIDTDHESFYEINSDVESSSLSSRRKRDERRFKLSLDTLMISDDNTHAIWTLEIDADFEIWFIKDTSWEINTKLKKAKHSSSIWESRSRKTNVWVDWHKIVVLRQERSYVICKDCEYVTLHLTSSRINNNTITRHRSRNQCTAQDRERVKNQQLLSTSF